LDQVAPRFSWIKFLCQGRWHSVWDEVL